MGAEKITEMAASLSEAGIAVICMDGFCGYDWSGRLYIRSRQEPFIYRGTLELLKALERFYDGINYPQASVNSRSFAPAVKNRRRPGEFHKAGRREQKVVLSKEQIQENRGKMATFLVRIQYRQRATWQGRITWVERHKTEEFRSMLELLKIMDLAGEGGVYQWSGADR